jgi:hypothetical protein
LDCSHNLLWTTSTFIENPPDFQFGVRSEIGRFLGATLLRSKTTLPVALRHAIGFPNLGLLRRLRHSLASSVKPVSAQAEVAA